MANKVDLRKLERYKEYTRKGLRASEISVLEGKSIDTVKHYLCTHGLPIVNDDDIKKEKIEKIKEQIIPLLKEQKTIKQIASEIDVPYYIIQNYIVKFNLQEYNPRLCKEQREARLKNRKEKERIKKEKEKLRLKQIKDDIVCEPIMTNDEICSSYRQAKYPKRQITILSQLNGLTKEEIKNILKNGKVLK